MSDSNLKNIIAPRRKEGCEALEMPDESLNCQTAICPKCTCTVIRVKEAVDTYICRRCNKAWMRDEVIDAR